MKYLLCSFESNDQKKVIQHYLNYHHIDSKHWFFQKLFQSDNRPFLKKCLRCKQFITNHEQKAKRFFETL